MADLMSPSGCPLLHFTAAQTHIINFTTTVLTVNTDHVRTPSIFICLLLQLQPNKHIVNKWAGIAWAAERDPPTEALTSTNLSKKFILEFNPSQK